MWIYLLIFVVFTALVDRLSNQAQEFFFSGDLLAPSSVFIELSSEEDLLDEDFPRELIRGWKGGRKCYNWFLSTGFKGFFWSFPCSLPIVYEVIF